MQPSYRQFNIITENVQKSSHRKELVLVTGVDKKDCYLGIIWKGKWKKTVYNIIPLNVSIECIVFYNGLIQLSLLILLYISTYEAVGFLLVSEDLVNIVYDIRKKIMYKSCFVT